MRAALMKVKQTINPVSSLNHYPIPKVEDLFSSLSNGKVFSKIDVSQAYQQVPLEIKSPHYTVINTHILKACSDIPGFLLESVHHQEFSNELYHEH